MSKLLTEAELAKELGQSPWTIRRWRLSEGLPYIQIGGRFLYNTESVETWVKAKESNATVPQVSPIVGTIREIRA